MRAIPFLLLLLLTAGCGQGGAALAPSATSVLTVTVDTTSPAPIRLTVADQGWTHQPALFADAVPAHQPIRIAVPMLATVYVWAIADGFGSAGQTVTVEGDDAITLRW